MSAQLNKVQDRTDSYPSDAVEPAVCFIESDPTFSGAELAKRQLAAHLETAPLTPDQRNRLAAVLLRALRHGSESLFGAYACLAPAITSPIFEAAVTCYADSCEHPMADRARRVLDALQGARPCAPTDRPPAGGRPGPAARHLQGAARRW